MPRYEPREEPRELARLLMIATALAAWVSLALQGVVSWRLMQPADMAQVIWRMAGYFTVLTNLAVALALTLAALRNRPLGAMLAGALTLSIVAVGIVYHAILAGLWHPVGLARVADEGLHTLVPIMTLFWWLGFAPRVRNAARAMIVWQVWPLAYLGYAILREVLTGFVPYPFLDLVALGAARVAGNALVILALFLVLSLAMLALGRLTRR